MPPSQVLNLQRAAGNAAVRRAVGGIAVQRSPDGDGGPGPTTDQVAFVREEGLNLRAGPDQSAAALTQLRFGQRVHLLDERKAGWQKVTALGKVGYVSAGRIHLPPTHLINDDPGLSLIRVRSGQTFWGLVKEVYGIQGNESTADQNINHFINAIRAVNKPDAFKVKTDFLDDVGNWFVSGRDASDTELIAGVDLWIPSFGAAAKADVASGTVTGEITRFVKKIEQKIDDFIAACRASGKYIPGAIASRCGEMAEGLLKGLIDFAMDAAKILAVSTAVGAMIGALFGGVGAIPGAEIGFEVGLLILEAYGLYMLIEAILGVAGDLVSQLGRFISQVWNANGDPKKIEEAGKTLADALGILVSAIMVVVAAYLLKKGAKALGKTKFAQTVGETRLAKWLEKREKATTTKEVVNGGAVISTIARQEARRLLAAAAKAEGVVTTTLQKLADTGGGRLAGLENKLKTEASLARKIADQARERMAGGRLTTEQAVKQVSAGIKDALRYTMEVPTGEYMATYQRTVQALESHGYTRNASKNTWAEPGSPQAGPYRGINESWSTPDGQVFELQFHTAESFEVKSESHAPYEEARAEGTSPARAKELNDQMTKMSDAIPVPDGAVPTDGTWPGGPRRKGGK
jgi:hypothetical protein